MRQEIERTAVAGMLNLADVLELVIDALDDRPFAQEQLVWEGHEPVAHVLTQFGDEVEALGQQELLGQRLRDVALVAEELAEEAADESGYRPPVIDVAWGKTDSEQVAAIIDHQMEFEAVKPAHRCFAAPRIHPKDAMLVDPGWTAHRERCGILWSQ